MRFIAETDGTARQALLVSCLAYIGVGCFASAVGPLLPQLASQTGSSLVAIGAIFTALSVGGLFAQLLAGPVSDHFSPLAVMLAGLAIMTLGVAARVFSTSLPVLLALALVAGFGQGAADIAGSLLVAATFTRRSVAAMNLLHLFFGLGATLGPAVVGLSLALWGTGLPALWLVIVLPLLLLPLTYSLRLSASGAHQPVRAPAATVYRSPLLWAFAGLLAVYVGIEIGMGGWSTVYLNTTTGLSLETAALVTSGYWLALSAGRLVSTLLGTRLGPYAILGLDLAGVGLASLVLFAGIGSWPLTVAGTLLMGFSFGSIYPTVMALVTSSFAGGPGRAASVITAASSVATMLLPWLQGALFVGLGPTSTPWFAATCCLAMLALYLLAWRLGRRGLRPQPVVG